MDRPTEFIVPLITWLEGIFKQNQNKINNIIIKNFFLSMQLNTAVIMKQKSKLKIKIESEKSESLIPCTKVSENNNKNYNL